MTTVFILAVILLFGYAWSIRLKELKKEHDEAMKKLKENESN